MPSVQSSFLDVNSPTGHGSWTSHQFCRLDWSISESFCSGQFPYMFLEMHAPTTENSTPTTALVMLPREEREFHVPCWLFSSS